MTEPKVVRRPTRHLRNIRAERWNTWGAVVMALAVLIVIGLDAAYFMGWLQ